MTDKTYLLPETDEARAKLRAWFDHRGEVISANCAAMRERLGEAFGEGYGTDFYNRPNTVRFKKHPGSDWTDRDCPSGCYRPKRSTRQGKEVYDWLRGLRTVTAERDFLGIKFNDSPFNRIQIIGHYPEGPTCLVLPVKCEYRPEGFREITAKEWDLVLAQYAVERERVPA